MFQAEALGIRVQDPASWGVTARARPSGGPRLGVLGAVTVACKRMVEDNDKRKKGQSKHIGSASSHRTTTALDIPSSQVCLSFAVVILFYVRSWHWLVLIFDA